MAAGTLLDYKRKNGKRYFSGFVQNITDPSVSCPCSAQMKVAHSGNPAAGTLCFTFSKEKMMHQFIQFAHKNILFIFAYLFIFAA